MFFICIFMYMYKLLFCLFLLNPLTSKAWGFWAHKRINKMAVFTLPVEMLILYKSNIGYISEHAVDPDKRRYAIEGEAPKHYIDLDHYCIYPCKTFPKYWSEAVEIYSKDTLLNYGISPWNIEWMLKKLSTAFKEQNKDAILKLSTELGHYIADSHVPLHTTKNYNGQLTNQHGIHGFWESRLPELFHPNYNYFVGKAEYIENPNEFIWQNILNAHKQLTKVFSYEKMIDSTFSTDKKFSFENRGQNLVKTYSQEYSMAYHSLLSGMVEKQMQLSIKHIGDLWYTCWINAGSPSLKNLSPSKNLENINADTDSLHSVKSKKRFHASYGIESIPSKGAP